MTVGIGTIAVTRQRVKECQVLGPTGKKKEMVIYSISEKRDKRNNHRKGHINTKIMCIFTLTKATCQELITRNSICALRLSQPFPLLILFLALGFSRNWKAHHNSHNFHPIILPCLPPVMSEISIFKTRNLSCK